LSLLKKRKKVCEKKTEKNSVEKKNQRDGKLSSTEAKNSFPLEEEKIQKYHRSRGTRFYSIFFVEVIFLQHQHQCIVQSNPETLNPKP
jgi:hypothetical protein